MTTKMRVLILLAIVFVLILFNDRPNSMSWYAHRAREFTPPPTYATWWKEMETCSGHTRDMSKTKFSVYDTTTDAVYIDSRQEDVLGWWTMFENSIVFIGKSAEVPHSVKHEMLHAILNMHGHPPEYFVFKCRVD